MQARMEDPAMVEAMRCIQETLVDRVTDSA
jgi:hypothetical protein